MSGIAAILSVLPIVVAVVIVWVATRRRRRGIAVSPRVVPMIEAARRRAVIAVLVAIAVLVSLSVAGLRWSALGQVFNVASLVAAAAGIAVYSAMPPRIVPVAEGEVRAATLIPRSLRSVVPRRRMLMFGATAVLFLLVVVFGGLTAADDDNGGWSRVIRFESPHASHMASPYPGWFYGIPALISLVVLIIATAAALHRISSTPAFPSADDAHIDAQWRRRTGETILGLSTGAILFTLGGIACIAGSAILRSVLDETSALWLVAGYGLVTLGVVALLASAVSVTVAGLTAAGIGARMTPFASETFGATP
ncbi:hypothetical protein FM104_08910 [Microbacterium esteraromaticum]|uniref:Uncharacterized protein n=1 Tax=Microbacterium esteraromaticum TaxID=57043 RepID=A0A1R4JTZ1_9MICO|nr:hypothetical protein [Microbacterium esteraromaticum]SJN35486.1 hypothetical protein FM104_08910 [Microbacterium esteraromaticum]